MLGPTSLIRRQVYIVLIVKKGLHSCALAKYKRHPQDSHKADTRAVSLHTDREPHDNAVSGSLARLPTGVRISGYLPGHTPVTTSRTCVKSRHTWDHKRGHECCLVAFMEHNFTSHLWPVEPSIGPRLVLREYDRGRVRHGRSLCRCFPALTLRVPWRTRLQGHDPPDPASPAQLGRSERRAASRHAGYSHQMWAVSPLQEPSCCMASKHFWVY